MCGKNEYEIKVLGAIAFDLLPCYVYKARLLR